MTLWDILALAVTVALVLEGLFRGAVRLGFGLAGLILGYLVAGRVAPILAKEMGFVPGAARYYVAACLGFGLVVLGAVLLGMLVHHLVKAVGLSLPNRVLGAFLGLAVACYLAGGLEAVVRNRSPRASRELSRSPVFSLLARGALFLEDLMDIRTAPPLKPAPTQPGDRA